MTNTFSGFPQAGLQFLAALAQNNNREWFQAHQSDYERTLRDPALALIAALGERLKTVSRDIRYDLRTNGAGSLMRIHRDTRFSQDKTPYKDHVDMMWWQGQGRKTENPAFGLRITATDAGLMAGMHHFSKPVLEAYREAVDSQKQGAALVKAIDAVKQAGAYPIGGEHYKRVPSGFAADHPRADLLRYTGLYVYSPTIAPEIVTSPDLIDVCFEHFVCMAPVYHWLIGMMPTP